MKIKDLFLGDPSEIKNKPDKKGLIKMAHPILDLQISDSFDSPSPSIKFPKDSVIKFRDDFLLVEKFVIDGSGVIFLFQRKNYENTISEVEFVSRLLDDEGNIILIGHIVGSTRSAEPLFSMIDYLAKRFETLFFRFSITVKVIKKNGESVGLAIYSNPTKKKECKMWCLIEQKVTSFSWEVEPAEAKK